VRDSFVHGSVTSHKGFGDSVSIDGDIAFMGSQNSVHMFCQGSNSKWVEFHRVYINATLEHAISGDTIVAENHVEGSIQLYKYMPNLDRAILF